MRDEACKVLSEIGGTKSLAALKEQAGKGERAAKAAIEKLQKRQ